MNLFKQKGFCSLITFVLLVTVNCAFAESHEGVRTIDNLGDTPWLFSKFDEMAKPISLRDNQKYVNKGVLAQIELDRAYSINKLSIRFKQNQAESINCKVEYFDNNTQQWNSCLDYSKESAKLIKKSSSQFQSVMQTFGMVEIIEQTSLEATINLSTNKIRVVVGDLKNKSGQSLDFDSAEVVLFEKDDKMSVEYLVSDFDDSAWTSVGVPHCYNDMDTYLNVSEIGNTMWRGEVWYRKHLKVDESKAGKRIFLEFESVNMAAAVYVNGFFQRGETKVPQPSEVTHVGCFLPFVLDITDAVKFGQDNIIAVRVSNANKSFYTWPGFAEYDGCGLGFGGIVGSVKMYMMNPVYVPLHSAAYEDNWGAYIATKSATDKSAVVRVITNIRNATDVNSKADLLISIIDAKGKVVATQQQSRDIRANSNGVSDCTVNLKNPSLWYPNNSPYGKPYLYTVEHRLSVNGEVTDISQTRFGIRTITWDSDYCYVNGKKHILRGFGSRNTYPALGSAIPADLYWKDVKLMADCGANTLRVGHASATLEMMDACDEYGIMLMQNSGDREWSLKGETAIAYKKEYDREMLISMRNRPCIAVWESNNGLARSNDEPVYAPSMTYDLVVEYDSIQPRIVHNRDCYPDKSLWNPENPLMVGYTNRYQKVEGSPSLNTEVYGTNWNGDPSFCIKRYDYENEKKFSSWYINNYLSDLRDRACGWIDWMLTETQGEGYTIYLDGTRNQKSLGSSAMDGNRFPKLKYNIYKEALWIDFATKPGVALQSNWNLELDKLHTIDAWSNCPQVELFVNKKSYGIRTPDKDTKQATWSDVRAERGALRVVGLNDAGKVVCKDIRVRSAEPYAVELIVEPASVKMDGTSLMLRANGSDVVIVTAKIVDKDGNWCPLADNVLTFNVVGEGDYRGSYNFLVTPDKPLPFHAPGSPELDAEGGLMRVAVRSTFKAGKVKVSCSSPTLKTGNIYYVTNSIH